ncbi:winged helix-turn-helix domain-containing protein [Candidatus Viridilinea mediisalina]|uniref:Transcriptional regulator n=1 Tax=Candidatus Viridilinea mediisalina TaxID=2024553 RepID=A0A2A6RFU0_9CHLR|nr:winged helix-turn-helix domain-containing protein [Candidatus Viridilinea mediisalina]PDW01745.1 transcriptional regulator [Candidatus Viridilinea mediisalina]
MIAAPAPKLLMKRQDGQYCELEWESEQMTIGRDGTNDIVIDHPLASRRHARLERVTDGFAVRDLGSTNGTFVNQERIEGLCSLHNHDQIIIADTVIVFHDPDATVKGVLPPELLRAAREEFRVDSKTKEVYIQGQLLQPPLTVKEFHLLELLYNRQGLVVSKDEIASNVWDYEVYDYNAIDALVYRLRQRIEADPANPRYLITQRGFGYKLITTP